MLTICGVDPGYDRLGWGILTVAKKQITFVDAGVLSSDRLLSPPARLDQIATAFRTVLHDFSPTHVVVEELFFARNAKTIVPVAQARGVILATAFSYGATIIEYTPMQVKLAVTGNGHADKQAVEKMMRLQLPGIPTSILDDTSDALALALSYVSTNQQLV